ncbi:threonylcarbamoyl-AMP synthase [Candidatus Dependentiae bacterium]|nr:threonylcarbamoyl-AMP synthase [Candidatus Dependentiae bacterium]
MLSSTRILDPSSSSDVTLAVDLLRAGEVVALPTETVYGLGADARNDRAVEKIFIAKGRPNNHPLIVHISSFEKITEWAKDVSPLAKKLADAFWPGPLTMLFHKADGVSDAVTGGLPTIGLRVPRNELFLEVLRQLDSGIAAPSANLHKKISPTCAEHVLSGLSGKIAAVFDAHACPVGLESTIVDLTSKIPRILRPGQITRQMLEKVLKTKVDDFEPHDVSVAGNMVDHYQPTTKLLVLSAEQFMPFLTEANKNKRRLGVLWFGAADLQQNELIVSRVMPTSRELYAQQLYAALHEIDAVGAELILVQQPPKEWSEIIDRLQKASYKQ